MNRTEQKEMITDIIEKVEIFKGELENKRSYIEDLCEKIDDLYGELPEDIEFDAGELKGKVLVSALETDTSFSDVYESLEEFRSEIEDVMNEMNPDTKRYETMEERYMDLDDICDWFNDASEYEDEDLDYVEDKVDEAIDLLKGMKK